MLKKQDEPIKGMDSSDWFLIFLTLLMYSIVILLIYLLIFKHAYFMVFPLGVFVFLEAITGSSRKFIKDTIQRWKNDEKTR
jgi:hypothetical protein